MYNDYQYFDVTGVSIPADMCPNNYTGAGQKCDNFYSVYCANILDMYKKQLKAAKGDSAEYNHEEFIRYKPECACFGDMSVFSEVPETFPRKCVFGGCGEGGKSYLDSGSRNANCSLNVCKSIINAANADVGGNMNIKSNITQTCGASLPPADRDALSAPAPATPAPATPAPATPAPATPAPATPAPTTPAPATSAPATPATTAAPATPATTAAPATPAPATTAAPTSTTSDSTSDDTEEDNTMLIAGGAGGLFLLCCCLFILMMMMRKK